MIALQPDEQIVAVIHRHWFIFFVQLLVHVVLYILPFLAYGYVVIALPETFVPPSASLLVFAAAVWTLLMWMKLFAAWMDYFLDQWIVTTQRVIDIEQIGFFSRRLGSFRMERIQDVSTDVHGLIPTLLNFGDVHVQTAGESQQFIIKGAGRPLFIKELILKHSDKVAR